MGLDEYLKAKNNTYKISIIKQPFSNQRLNLKLEIFRNLYNNYLKDFYIFFKEVKNIRDDIFSYRCPMFETPNIKGLGEIYQNKQNYI